MFIQTPTSLDEFPDLIPHREDMSLWQTILKADCDHIRCSTRTHLNPNHPLRVGNTLPAISLVEYGAQSIAIHGGLLAIHQNSNSKTLKPKMGYIASLKSIQFYSFNPETETLFVDATQESADELAKLYTFQITDANNHKICKGKVLVMHPQNKSKHNS